LLARKASRQVELSSPYSNSGQIDEVVPILHELEE